MTGLAWGALGLIGMFLFGALGDLVSEEIRAWLDLVPHAILRLAAAQLDPELRESIYEGEWLPELIYILRGAESRPITRLIRGMRFALGLLFSARGIARYHVPPSDPIVPLPPPTERHRSSVVVGAGAVGSGLAELLAQMGVTSLRLIDLDTPHTENLARYALNHPVDGTGTR
jgi:ThiF family